MITVDYFKDDNRLDFVIKFIDKDINKGMFLTQRKGFDVNKDLKELEVKLCVLCKEMKIDPSLYINDARLAYTYFYHKE